MKKIFSNFIIYSISFLVLFLLNFHLYAQAPTVANVSRCGTGTAVLTASGAPSGGSYRWYNTAVGGTPIVGANVASFTTPSLATTTDFFASTVAADGTTESSRTKATVTVNLLSNAQIIQGAIIGYCNTTSITLNAAIVAGATYQWQRFSPLGGGSFQTETGPGNNSPVYTVNLPITGFFRIAVTGTNGCTAFSPVIEIVANYTPEAIILTGITGTICVGQSVLLQAKTDELSVGNAYQWIYSLNNTTYGNISGGTTSSISVNQPGFYKVQVTKNNCPATSDFTQLAQSPTPTASIQEGTMANLCAGENIVLNAQTDIGDQFQWLVGLTAMGPFVPASGTNTGVKYTATNSGFYTVEISKNGCAKRSNPIQVNQEPAAVALITNTSPTSYCFGNAIILNGQTATGNTYQWKYSATAAGMFANISGANSPTYSAGQAGFYSLEVKKTGCISVVNSAPVQVTETKAVIQEFPTASFCKGANVTLNSVTIAGGTYQWQFAASASGAFANATGTSNAATYTTNTTGFYKFSVTKDGCTHVSDAVQVKEKTATIAQGASTTFCRGGSVVLIASETGAGLAYSWLFSTTLVGTYTPGSGINNSSAYNADKVGFYRLRITDGGCDNTSDPIAVTESPVQPTALILQGATAQFCIGGDVAITALSQAGATYLWKYSATAAGVYAPASGMNSNVINYLASIEGFYVLEVSNGGCVITSSPTNVTQINTMPKPPIQQGGTAFFCIGGSVNLFCLLNMSNISFQWQFSPTATGTFTPASGTNNEQTYNTNQVGFYKVRVTRPGCGTNISDVTEVRQTTTLPIAKVLQSSPASFCLGGDVLLEAQTGTGYQYLWQYSTTATGTFANAAGSNSQATYSAKQVGFVRVQVSLGGCVVNSTAIEVKQASATPKPEIEQGTAVSFCQGGSANLTTLMKGTGYTYQWQFSATAGGTFSPASGSSTAFTYAANTVGFYRVTVTIPNCGSATSDNIQVSQSSQKPVATIVQGTAAQFCSGGDIILDAIQGIGYQYQWKYAATPTAPLANASGVSNLPSYTATDAGFYVIEISLNGCVEVSVPISVTITTTMPKPLIVQGSNAAFCQGGSIVLNAQTKSTKYTYRWEVSATATGTYSPASGISSQDNYNAMTAGFYRLVTSSPTCGTAISDPVQIKVSTVIPTAKVLQGATTQFCANGDIILDAQTGIDYKYRWLYSATAAGTFNDATGANTNATYTANVVGFYKVEVTFDGCKATSDATSVSSTTVMPKPAITQGGTVTFCAGGSVTLTALSKSTKYTYQWLFSATNAGTFASASGTNNTDSYNTSQSGFYKLKTTSDCGTDESSATEIKQTTEKPKAEIIQAPAAQFCSSGGDVILEAVQGTDYQYQWKFSATQTGTYANASGSSKSFSYTTNIAGFYVVEVTFNACVATSAPIQVSGIPTMPPATLVQSGVIQFCKGESTTLDAKSKGTNYQYQWLYSSSATGTFANASGNSTGTSYTASVTGFYKLRTSLTSCGASTSDAIQLIESPFTPDPKILQAPTTSLCQGGDVFLEVTPENGVSYLWLFSETVGGNFKAAEGKNNEILYAATKEGFYRVAASLGACIKTSAAIEVKISNTLPAPKITPLGKIFFCRGGNATITSLYKGSKITYQWQSATSATGTFTNVANGNAATFSISQAGFYRLAISSTGCGTAVSTIIEVAETTVLPLATILQGAKAEYCINGGDVLLEAQANPNYSYQWKFSATAGGTFANAVGTSTQSSYLTSQAGFYSLEVSVNGCKASSQPTQVEGVTTLSKPTILQGVNVEFCQGNTAVLQTTVKGTGYVYRWVFSTSATGNFEQATGNAATTATYATTTEGFYRLEISRQGCGSNISEIIKVSSKPSPTLTFTTAKTIDICEGANVQLGVEEVSGATYAWKGANGFTSLLRNPLLNALKANASGFYVVTLTAANACAVTDSILVRVNSPTAFSVTTTDNVCTSDKNGAIRIANTGQNLQYRLGTTGSYEAVTSFNNLATGNYTLFARNELGCEGSQVVSIKASNPAGATINAGADVSIQKGKAVKLLASGVPNYKWTPTTGLSDPNIADPVANPLQTTTYTVSGKDQTTGCEISDQVTVTVNDSGELVITNLLTPDNNGINDTWEIVNIDGYPDADIRVYDRWGLEVFSTVGYNNTWEGKSKSGESLPDGAYYYQVSVTIRGQRKTFSGAMNIMR